MFVVERLTGRKIKVVVEPVVKEDYKNITKTKYFFNWKTEKRHKVYKLRLSGSDSVLGLVSFIKQDDEQRIEINLLSVSIENRGKRKKYERITGCLIACVCKVAVTEYGEYACVSLIPKTLLKKHYVKSYGMKEAGRSVYLEDKCLLELLLKYEL